MTDQPAAGVPAMAPDDGPESGRASGGLSSRGLSRGCLSRRGLLHSGALLAGLAGTPALGGALRPVSPAPLAADLIFPTPQGVLQIKALGPAAFRVRLAPDGSGLALPPSPILAAQAQSHGPASSRKPKITHHGQLTRLSLPNLVCELDRATGTLRFTDGKGQILLAETGQPRAMERFTADDGQPAWRLRQTFASPPDEALFGTGCFQDGALDLRGLPRRLTQVNTQISLPFLLSSKGYGLLWLQRGMSELNRPAQSISLERQSEASSQLADVTTDSGNARVTRKEAWFTGSFATTTAGPVALLLDLGRKMASRHTIEIDGQTLCDHANLWLPPTTSLIANLPAGAHQIRVLASSEDRPRLHYGPQMAQTTWETPVGDPLDYVVIGANSPDPSASIMAQYAKLVGPAPMMPVWALGYIHCRERFHSSAEIMETARAFRARRLPVDMMVQDWQYWGRHGWNAMRFDEEHYPDPAALCHDLHGMDLRLMLSVWSKVGRQTALGGQMAQRGFYIKDTEWIDFFNPQAARFYTDNQTQKLGKLGIDAWWQDATEPENDDLAGRQTAQGSGERLRLAYPLAVSAQVYKAQRAAFPDRRVMILTRSAFPGQQRYGAATWSGDIGHDWETLRRQIPAGLNMAAAGYAWWTVDAGGFFRPGPSQYSDPAYHERFLRWFQFATFLPLQRVHGYQTDTEFWRYGQQVESEARRYLELRYRLLPYIYALAAQNSAEGMPLIRPLVFDFATDTASLAQKHSYMFGPALHVAPVLAPISSLQGSSSQDKTLQDPRWPVYLPPNQGGWVDFWDGTHRAGGMTHAVPCPISRIPLHLRAGAIVPLGPVVQAAPHALQADLDLVVVAGRDGHAMLYDDDGTSYACEKGAAARIALRWDDAARRLSIGARQGGFAGMRAQRRMTIRLIDPRQPATGGALDQPAQRKLTYSGAAQSIQL